MTKNFQMQDEFFEDYPEEEFLPRILEMKGIKDKEVIAAFNIIKRPFFYEDEYLDDEKKNTALPIEINKTWIEPYLIAYVAEKIKSTGSMEKVLEIGTGVGYQTAVLAQLAEHVFSVERVQEKFKVAEEKLNKLNTKNVFLKLADGKDGWKEHAPFDAIIVKLAAQEVAEALISQLKDGGRLIVISGGPEFFEITVIKKEGEKIVRNEPERVSVFPLMPGVGGEKE